MKIKTSVRHRRQSNTHVVRCVLLASIVGGCANQATQTASLDPSETIASVTLFDSATAISDRWIHQPVRGKTTYRLTAQDGKVSIQAVGRQSASALMRRVDLDPQRCSSLVWQWRVDRLQPSADLRIKDKEDVAASLFLLFGDPGFMSNPTPVPTLRYVWSNAKHRENAIIDNPYLPGVVRSVVVRTGGVGRWMTEKRNIYQDFERAFGEKPKEAVHAIALFSDNDQTKEPVIAYYRWAKALCRSR